MLNALRWWVIATLLSLTLLVEAPLIAFPFYAGEQYQGINIAHFGNDEHHYLSRGKEVLEGNRLGQMYLPVWKEKEDSFQSNIEQIVLFPFAVSGVGNLMSVTTLYNILNTVGVFVMLLLMYLFAYALSKERMVALAAAVFAVGGYVLIENGTIFYSYLQSGHLFYDNFNIYGRSAFPYMALVPFFAFLLCAYMAMNRLYEWPLRREVRPYLWIIAAGALLGLLFYDYFYAWTYALATLGTATLAALITRRWSAAGAAVSIGGIGIVLGSWKLWGYYSLFTSPLGEQFSYFFMTAHSRGFIMSTTGIAILVLFFVYYYFKRNDPNNYILISLIAAGWIALEQQMITGRTVQYGHYYWYFVVPLTIIVAVYIAVNLVPERSKRFAPWLCALFVIAAFINTIGGQYRSFWTTIPGKMQEQQFAPVLEKLRDVPKATVLSDPGADSTALLVTIYTDHDIYWVPAASTSAFPPEHLKDALFVYLTLNKNARQSAEVYLREILASSTPNSYVYMYEILEGLEHSIPRRTYEKTPFPHLSEARDQYLPKFVAEYREFARSRENLFNALERGGIKYVLWDQGRYPEWDLSVLGPLEILATSTDLTLYRVSTTR